MPYIYADVDKLEDTKKVGSNQCVALVQHYAKAPVVATWREGDSVKDNLMIKKGTAIATFVNGKYPNKPHGNHAALYLGQDKSAIYVMDQWDSDKKNVSSRALPFLGKNSDGSYKNSSNNGDAFSIIK